MSTARQCLLSSIVLVSALASAQDAALLGDLDAAGRTTLTKEELTALLPGAKMSRITGRGNQQFWKNDAGGSFTVSTENRERAGGQPTTAQGKWNISEDGRYCVLIEWRTNPTEEWCRYVVKSGADYYGTKSDKLGTEKVYKMTISK